MMTEFNYYRATITDSKPIGLISPEQFFRAIRDPKPHIKDLFAQIKKAHADGDAKLKAELKTHLFSFTPCIQVEGRRRYADIVKFTGLLALDFDKLPPGDAPAFKQYLFNNYDYVVAAWLSASGSGVRALVSIPQAKSVDEFKQYYNAIEKFEMSQYIGYDHAPLNPALPLFLSHDPDILIREEPSTFADRYSPPVSQPIRQYTVQDESERVIKIITSAIRKINDNGHPQLRAAAYCLGGYVGAGYIEHGLALHTIEGLIDTNKYLSIKPDVYKKTAATMIEKGSGDPLYLR